MRVMPRFRADTDQLAAGEGHAAAIAGVLAEAAGLMRAAAGSIADAAGHAGASAAGAAFGSAWEQSLAGHGEAVQRSGRNVAAAAAAYRETDEGQMRG